MVNKFNLYLNKSIPMNIGSNLLVKKDPFEPVDDQLFPCLFVAHWFVFILIIPCSMNDIKAFVWCKFYRKPLYSMAKNPWESPWFPAVWKSLAPGASCTRTAWGEHFCGDFNDFTSTKCGISTVDCENAGVLRRWDVIFTKGWIWPEKNWKLTGKFEDWSIVKQGYAQHRPKKSDWWFKVF